MFDRHHHHTTIKNSPDVMKVIQPATGEQLRLLDDMRADAQKHVTRTLCTIEDNGFSAEIFHFDATKQDYFGVFILNGHKYVFTFDARIIDSAATEMKQYKFPADPNGIVKERIVRGVIDALAKTIAQSMIQIMKRS